MDGKDLIGAAVQENNFVSMQIPTEHLYSENLAKIFFVSAWLLLDGRINRHPEDSDRMLFKILLQQQHM